MKASTRRPFASSAAPARPTRREAEVAALRATGVRARVRRGRPRRKPRPARGRPSTLLRAKTGAAEADAKGRDAALAFAGHAERWLLLETARQLMVRAVERYRVQNEDPMISRASELLARIAAGAENPIIRLGVDYRDGRAPVIVGQRGDGRSCDVPEMSEGTRDQLFLCLRIAAIELYAKEREPLPFIADDLFVTSDDDRVVPGPRRARRARAHDPGAPFHPSSPRRRGREDTCPPGAVRVHELAGSRDPPRRSRTRPERLVKR